MTDVNVSPSLESNSLAFQAAAHSGLSPTMLLRQVVTQSCQRQLTDIPPLLPVDSVENTIFAPPIMALVCLPLWLLLLR